MHKFLLVILVALVVPSASAREYGNYDPKRLLTVAETPSGKKYGFDGAYLDQMLNDLSAHAKNYPPQFDTPQDQQRATQDVKALSGMLDILINVPTPNPELLARAGYLNSIGQISTFPGRPKRPIQSSCGYLPQRHPTRVAITCMEPSWRAQANPRKRFRILKRLFLLASLMRRTLSA